MKIKVSLSLHLALLVVSGVVAYQVFNQSDKQTATGKVIVDADRARLERVVYEAPNKKVEATVRSGGGFTLSLNEQKPKAKPPEPKPPVAAMDGGPVDGGVADGGSAPRSTASADGGTVDGAAATPAVTAEPPKPPEMETKVSSYRANEEFEQAMDRLLPLRAERDLGKVEPQKLAALGLDKTEKKLSLTVKGQTVVFHIGGEVFGGATTYIRSEADGTVYLVTTSLLRSLDITSGRYLERRLTPVSEKEADRLVVSQGVSTRTLEHRDKELPNGGRWVPADNPENSEEQIKNWIGKFYRIQVSEYVADASGVNVRELAKVQVEKGKDPPTLVSLLLAETSDNKKDYYARSAFTGGLVKLERISAEAAINDLASVLSTDKSSLPSFSPSEPVKTP